jgi:hypothetical protein
MNVGISQMQVCVRVTGILDGTRAIGYACFMRQEVRSA